MACGVACIKESVRVFIRRCVCGDINHHVADENESSEGILKWF